jgi:UDP-N-acetylglucosamine 1-carboxyvinyltransferase
VRCLCQIRARPAVVILLAMPAPKGTSVLRSTYVIHRVYEDLAERLNERGVHHAFRDV